jgi:hypothetical protein
MLPGCLFGHPDLLGRCPSISTARPFISATNWQMSSLAADVASPLTVNAALVRSSGPPDAAWRAAFLTLFGHLDMDRHSAKMTG